MMRWETLRKLPMPALCAVLGLGTGTLIGVSSIAMLDSDREYKIGTPIASLEISANQNSPISKCKSAQNGLEAELSSEEADLSRINAMVAQKQKIVDDMRDLYLRQGIVQVSNAQEQAYYDAMHSFVTGNLVMSSQKQELRQPAPNVGEQPRRIISSYILNDNINELRAMQADYSKQQAVKAQTRLEFDQLRRQCFSVGSKL